MISYNKFESRWNLTLMPFTILQLYPLKMLKAATYCISRRIKSYSNMTSFFRFVNKRVSYPFGIISLAHAPVNVTDFSIGSINRVRHFFRKRKYKLPSSNQSILPYLYSQTNQNRNKSWKPECVLSFNMGWQILVFYTEPEASFNMGWRILVFYPEPEARNKIY